MIWLNKDEIKKRKDINHFLDQWKEVMYHTNLFNDGNQTFNLSNLKKEEEYGYSATILPPYGYSFDNLENVREIIQDNLGCMFINKVNSSRKSSSVRFVTKEFNSGEYYPIDIKPWQLYLGKGMDGKPIIGDMYKHPMIMITGATNSGKTKMMDCFVTTLIYKYNEKEIILFFIQLAKDDSIIYEDCRQCYGFADNVNDSVIIMKHIIDDILPYRNGLVKPMHKKGKGNNIVDYNKKYPENHQPIVYVIIDEMASLLPSPGDDANTKKNKQYLISASEQIVQFGRASCVYLVSCTQRSSVKEISSYIKSQSNIKVSFRQNTKKASEVCMDDGEIAYQLPPRLGVVELDGYEYLKVPEILDETIFKYITPSLKPNHRTLFSDLKKLENDFREQDIADHMEEMDNKDSSSYFNNKKSNEKEIPKNKGEAPAPPQSKNKKYKEDFINNAEGINNSDIIYDKVDPIIIQENDEKMKENIKKIPNFVPYTPNNIEKNMVIIDETDWSKFKTEKPIKKGDS